MSKPNKVIVELIHTPRSVFNVRSRTQPWRWRALSANGRVLAVSSEAYTNRADAVAAIWLVFGWETCVDLDDHGSRSGLLRLRDALPTDEVTE